MGLQAGSLFGNYLGTSSGSAKYRNSYPPCSIQKRLRPKEVFRLRALRLCSGHAMKEESATFHEHVLGAQGTHMNAWMRITASQTAQFI